ncbi:MAG: type II toxin-antitoxin system RelE/ParE family toxin [Chlorobium sp.]|nr:MAG: type II toxin-antitoxin system RelE/ParE family toxin [Chlorobium sp.]
MVWKIEMTGEAEKELARIDKSAAKRIIRYLRERVSVDPRASGKSLRGDLSGLWRYRVGDYRLICELFDEKVSVLVIRIGHRKDVYR